MAQPVPLQTSYFHILRCDYIINLLRVADVVRIPFPLRTVHCLIWQPQSVNELIKLLVQPRRSPGAGPADMNGPHQNRFVGQIKIIKPSSPVKI